MLYISHPYILSVNEEFNKQNNTPQEKSACIMKLNTTGLGFLVNCYEEAFEKAIKSTLKVSTFQLENVLNFAEMRKLKVHSSKLILVFAFNFLHFFTIDLSEFSPKK